MNIGEPPGTRLRSQTAEFNPFRHPALLKCVIVRKRHAAIPSCAYAREVTVDDFTNAKQTNGLSVKLWRGERMCLVGMDVGQPEPDFVGFSIEVKSPGSSDFMPLRNRLAFSYDKPVDQAVDGHRNYSSLEAPFQN
jgi:hypothetical protein